MARGKGYGAGFGFSRPRGGDDVSRPMPGRAKGLYGEPNRPGGIRVPTLIEGYERDSDYRRWQAGMQMWFGKGKAWLDQQQAFYAQLKTPPVGGAMPLVVQMFASLDSPESAWQTTLRPRGAILMPEPIRPGQLSLDRSGEPGQHRLIYDVRGVLDRDRLSVWRAFIGDQFEDSARGSIYPDDLIEQPLGAVALTLVEVDVSTFRLIFDLSRPFVRHVSGPRTYWRRIGYSPQAPVFWLADGSRHLCSSHRFECSCPDYQGRAIANLQGTGGPVRERFPVESAGRGAQIPWEQDAIGYSKKWRDLDRRMDRRRECKHIHAVRWQAGVPYYEPSDYPTMEERDWVDDRSLLDRAYSFRELGQFLARQMISFDRLLLGVAPSVGLELDPTGELRGGAPTFRPVNQPILWSDSTEPPYAWCRQNDWWSPRGTQRVLLFDPPSGGFVEELDGEPVLRPVPGLGLTDGVVVLPGQRQPRMGLVLQARGGLLLRLRVQVQPRGRLQGTGGLGNSRLVRDALLDGQLVGRGGLRLGPLYAAPVADLEAALVGRGSLQGSTLASTATRTPVAALAGTGGLGVSLTMAPRIDVAGVLAGAGGLSAELSSRPDRDYFGDWAVQRFGTEELGLIEWWGG